MKKKAFICLITTATVLLSGCGAATSLSLDEASYAAPERSYITLANASESAGMSENNILSEEALMGVSSEKNMKSEVVADQTKKMIYTADVEIETTDFTAATEAFRVQIEDAGGYIETERYSSADANTSAFRNAATNDTSSVRHFYYATARIPADVYDASLEKLSDLGEVTSLTSSADNQTQAYRDLSIRLDILEDSYKQYKKLLNEAEDVETLLQIQNQLYETEIEIEQTKASLNRIDKDVAMSFINISINEVEKYEEKPDTFSEKCANAFKNGFELFADGMQSFALFLITAFPFILLIAGIIAVVLWIISVVSKAQKIKAQLDKDVEELKAEKAAEKENESPSEPEYVEAIPDESDQDIDKVPAQKPDQTSEK